MSARPPPEPPKPKKDEGLPGCTEAEVQHNLEKLPRGRKENMVNLLREVAQGDFYEKKRFTQGVRLIKLMKVYGVKQKDIAVVLDVSEGLVSQYKKHYRNNPTEEPPRSGAPSALSDAYEVIKNFIDAKNNNKEAVTMASLMSFINDELRIPVTTKTLSAHLQRKDFVYSPALPRDTARVDIERRDVEQYYNDLEAQLNGSTQASSSTWTRWALKCSQTKRRCMCL